VWVTLLPAQPRKISLHNRRPNYGQSISHEFQWLAHLSQLCLLPKLLDRQCCIYSNSDEEKKPAVFIPKFQSFLSCCFSHKPKTCRNLDLDIPLRTNTMHQTPRVKDSNEDGLHFQSTLSYFFCGLRDDPDSHSEYAASFQHCYYRKQQQDPESPLIHIQSSYGLHTILNRGCECRPRNFWTDIIN
jgi:hypothetical protein